MSITRVPFVILLLFSLALAPAAQERDALGAFRQGRYAEAIEITTDELNSNPSNRDAMTVQGWSLIALGRFQEAASIADRGLSLAPRDYRLAFIKAEAEFNRGNFRESLRFLERYADIVPEGSRIADAYYFMGVILTELGEFRNADTALSMAVHLSSGNVSWWVQLGEVRETLADFVEAEQAFSRALQLNPNATAAQAGLERVRSRIRQL